MKYNTTMQKCKMAKGQECARSEVKGRSAEGLKLGQNSQVGKDRRVKVHQGKGPGMPKCKRDGVQRCTRAKVQ